MNRARARRLGTTVLRARLARLPAILVTCGLMLGYGWIVATQWDAPMERCLARYDQARTAADSVRVDRTGKSLRGRTTCGDLRRAGMLDRHRQAEARRAASSSAREPLIEK